MSVCLSASISVEFHAHQIFMHVTYGRGSFTALVTLRYVMYFRFYGGSHVCTQWPGIGV